MSEDSAQLKRRIRSFVIRSGRMTKGQRRAYEQTWSQIGIDFSQLADKSIDLGAFFADAAPIVLEIGFGMGQSLAQMAQAFPEKNFLGIEVHSPGVGKMLQLIQEQELKNIRLLEHDAVEVLQRCIPASSMGEVQIFFPDPWHKTKHHKRRLIQPAFVALLDRCLKPGGTIHLATDWEDYAKQMLKVLEAQAGFTNLAGQGRFSPRPDHRPLTKFENRGVKLGHGVWDIMFEKAKLNSP